MKKIISALLVLVMVASMGAFAFADASAFPKSFKEATPDFPITPVQQAKIDAAIAAAEKAAAEAPIDTREEVDAYICKVDSRYTDVRNKMKVGPCYASTDKSVLLHFIKNDLGQIEINGGYYGNFTLDKDGNLVFCYYENSKESYRMYFLDDVLVYVLYRDHVANTSTKKYLTAAEEDFAEWAVKALDDVNEVKAAMKGDSNNIKFAAFEPKEAAVEAPEKQPTKEDIICAKIDDAVIKAYGETHYGAFEAVKVRTGIVAKLVNGKCRTIDMNKGTSGLAFERKFYLDNEGNVIYCCYGNADETYRLYFEEGELVRAIYTANGVQTTTEGDALSDSIYAEWAECAIAECSSILRDAAL